MCRCMASLLKRFAYAGKEGKPAAEAAAKELKKSKDYVQRRFAVVALGTLGDEAAPWVEILTNALSDDDAGVRYHTAIVIGSLGPALAEHSAAVAKALADPDPGVRLYVVEALGKLGEKALGQADALMEALRSDKDPHVRLAAAQAVLNVQPSSAAAASEIFAKEYRKLEEELIDEVFYRVCACEGLAILYRTAQPHASVLRKALSDSFQGVRAAAARALTLLGASEVRPAAEVLARLAKEDPHDAVRKAAAVALERLDANDALRNDDAFMRYWAVSSMADNGAKAEPQAQALADMLQDSEVDNRRLAAVALEGIKQAAAPHNEALLRSLGDGVGAVRVAAMRALVATAEPQVVETALEVVAAALTDQDAELRAAAAQCMASAGFAAKAHAEALIAALDDEEFPVRLAAVRAIDGSGRMGVRAAGAKLGHLALKDPDIDVRRAASSCLREYRLDKRFGLPEPKI